MKRIICLQQIFCCCSRKPEIGFGSSPSSKNFLAGQFSENGIRCCSKRKSPAADFWT